MNLDDYIIVIDGGDIFEGTIRQLEDCFFVTADEENIRIWAERNQWSVQFRPIE